MKMTPTCPLFFSPDATVARPSRWSLRLLSLSAAVALMGAAGAVSAQTPDALDPAFNGSTNNTVVAVTVQPDGRLLLGGNFTTVDGAPRANVARLNADGSLDLGFNASADATVDAVAVQPDGKLVIGGSFATVNGTAHNGVARLNADGSPDAGFNGNVLGDVFTVAAQPDGKVVVGGSFAIVNGEARSNIVRLNVDGGLDRGFTTRTNGSSIVFAAALQPDGKIVLGGDFTQISGSNQSRIARLNADGTLDRSFVVTADGSVNTVVVQPDGKVVIGGTFSSVNGVARGGIARLNVDGSLDAGFAASTDGTVTGAALQPDGQLVIVGTFDTVNGTARGGVARLNADGNLGSGFNPSLSGGSDFALRAVALQPDGRIILGGAFNQVNGAGRSGIARFLGGADSRPTGPVVVSVVGAGPTRGGFVVSRTGSVDLPVTVVYHNGGSAIRDQDYVALPGTVTIPAGQSEAVIPVTLLPGANRGKKVKVFLDPAPDGSSYGIAKTQSKVFLSDLP